MFNTVLNRTAGHELAQHPKAGPVSALRTLIWHSCDEIGGIKVRTSDFDLEHGVTR